jgi:hypothetical protein
MEEISTPYLLDEEHPYKILIVKLLPEEFDKLVEATAKRTVELLKEKMNINDPNTLDEQTALRGIASAALNRAIRDRDAAESRVAVLEQQHAEAEKVIRAATVADPDVEAVRASHEDTQALVKAVRKGFDYSGIKWPPRIVQAEAALDALAARLEAETRRADEAEKLIRDAEAVIFEGVREDAPTVTGATWAELQEDADEVRMGLLKFLGKTTVDRTFPRLARLEAETRARENAEKALADARLRLAVFAPHGGDSQRVGDYMFAEEMRADLDRIAAALAAARTGEAADGHTTDVD